MKFKLRVLTFILGLSMIAAGSAQPLLTRADGTKPDGHVHTYENEGNWTADGDTGHYRTITECQVTSGESVVTSAACSVNGNRETEAHKYVKGVCSECNHTHEAHKYNAANGVCTECNYTHTPHDTISGGACSVCGYKEPGLEPEDPNAFKFNSASLTKKSDGKPINPDTIISAETTLVLNVAYQNLEEPKVASFVFTGETTGDTLSGNANLIETASTSAQIVFDVTEGIKNDKYHLSSLTFAGDEHITDLNGAVPYFTKDFTSTKHTHTYVYSDEWTSDADYHWHVGICSANDGATTIKDKAAHTPGTWQIDLPPTQTEYGQRAIYCTVCARKLQSELISPTQTEEKISTMSTLLEDIKALPDKSSIRVDYQTNPIVSADVFNALRNTQKILTLYSGNGTTWEFKGENIKNTAKDIDLRVSTSVLSQHTNANIIRQIVGDNSAVVLSFPENGILPGVATVSIPLTDSQVKSIGVSGLYVYYINPATKSAEIIAKEAMISNNIISFVIGHNSDYVITKGPIVGAETNTIDNGNGTGTNTVTTTTRIIRTTASSPKTGNFLMEYYWLFIIAAGLSLVIASLLFLGEKREVVYNTINTDDAKFIGYRDASDYLNKMRRK